MDEARRGRITEEVKAAAKEEGLEPEKLRRGIASGKIILTGYARGERCKIVAVGEGLRTKVNANVGASSEFSNIKIELEKALTAVRYGADTLMDLSTSEDLNEIRRLILKETPLPVGTVPIYQAGVEAIRKHGAIVDMGEDEVLRVVENHAKEGVDFMTIHAGITQGITAQLAEHPRVAGVVSRGGVFLASWILHHKAENPFYKNFDYLLEIARSYDFCISLGDSLRPGSLADASDWFQIQELLTVQKLVERCWRAGVQVMVEGPGHLPLNQVEANVVLHKSLCKGAPLYLLGPIVTDIGAGYDHIVGAVGGAVAAMAGADFLCYVTPSEHLALPTVEDVREGVIAARLAAHCADVVKLGERASRHDLEMAQARAKLDWETMYKLSLDPVRAREVREKGKTKTDACTMCGQYCVYRILPAKQTGCI